MIHFQRKWIYWSSSKSSSQKRTLTAAQLDGRRPGGSRKDDIGATEASLSNLKVHFHELFKPNWNLTVNIVMYYDFLFRECEVTATRLDLASLPARLPPVSVVVTAGGDGTFLAAASLVYDSTPIIGINTDPTGLVSPTRSFLCVFRWK